MIDKNLFKKLADKYSTPLYVYNFDAITKNFNMLKNEFRARKSLICYALKANSNLSILKHLATLGSGADCVSINEVKLALKAKIPKYKIIYSGVGKSDLDIKEALISDILFINIESSEEMLRVEDIAKSLNKKARISIRVNPDVNTKTHPYISTGLKENKFGINIDDAKQNYIYAKNSNYLDPIGIHFHIGSQLLSLEPILESAEKIVKLVFGLLALKIDIKFIDVGGGIGIQYNNETTINIYDYAQGILAKLNGLDITIICEPGRYILGNAGYLLSKVLYEKQNNYKRFVIIDAAMNDFIRPSLYNAKHRIEHIKCSKNNPTSNTNIINKADIVGPVCESGDYMAKDVTIKQTTKNDLIVIYDVGAYGFSMSSNYNSRLKPAEIALNNNEDKLIRRREEFNDLLRCEIDESK